jgi:histidinol dehydrogenase
VTRVREFHEKQKIQGFEYLDAMKNRLGQKVVPLDSVMTYVPGGRALYPSTFYMTVIPAQIAGVPRIAVMSPPRTFIESSEVCRLIEILDIREVYRIGGAQAVIAAAYGAGPVRPVSKITGPGNIYVAKAKQMVYGKTDIDMIAGPSEILLIADTLDEAEIPMIASDLLSQAEHDPMARSVVIGYRKDFLEKISVKLNELAGKLPEPQKSNALASIVNRGIMIGVKDRVAAVDVSNALAPEHLELFSDDPYPMLERVTSGASVFLGKFTPEAVGDYLGGPNHVLPTNNTARFYSPLGVYSYQKRISYVEFSQASLQYYAPMITSIARSEKLEAHARSVESRFIEES